MAVLMFFFKGMERTNSIKKKMYSKGDNPSHRALNIKSYFSLDNEQRFRFSNPLVSIVIFLFIVFSEISKSKTVYVKVHKSIVGIWKFSARDLHSLTGLL